MIPTHAKPGEARFLSQGGRPAHAGHLSSWASWAKQQLGQPLDTERSLCAMMECKSESKRKHLFVRPPPSLLALLTGFPRPRCSLSWLPCGLLASLVVSWAATRTIHGTTFALSSAEMRPFPSNIVRLNACPPPTASVTQTDLRCRTNRGPNQSAIHAGPSRTI